MRSIQLVRANARTGRLSRPAFAFALALSATVLLSPAAPTPLARGSTPNAARAMGSSAYSQAVLSDNPWGYWKLNESSGTVAADSSGNNRPMTVDDRGWPTPTPWGQPGPTLVDTAPLLRGNPNGWTPGDRVYRDPVSASLFVDDFTAELWVYPNPLATDNSGFLIGKGNPVRAYGTNGWGLLVDSGRLKLFVNGNSVMAGPNIPVGTWTYVAVRRSGGVWTIFTNGGPSGSSSVQPIAGGQDIYFGADGWSGGGFNFNGRIAQGAFYTSALSTDRVEAHYEAVPVVDVPGVETYGLPTASAACGTFACNPSGTQAEPVNTATGSYVTQTTDLSLPGIGVPFTLTRTYNSADSTSGPLGPGWTHSLNASLTIKVSGDAIARGGDGQQVYFTRQADGSFRSDRGGRVMLSSISGGYELVTADQIHLRFDSQGRLVSKLDRNGKGLTLTYGSNGKVATVVDAVGRSISFAYNTSGLLTGVTLPGGRNVGYAYTSGRLSSVTDVRGGTTSYTYDGGGRLNKITDQNSHAVVTNSYGSDGRVTQQIDALGHTTTFDWDATTQTATMTDARSNAWKDVYFNNVLQRRIDPLSHTTSYEYDRNLNLTKVTDPRGNATTMTWDSHGNLLTRTAPAPLSYQESFAYDSLNDLLSYTGGRGNTTTFGYDAAGNLTSATQPGSIVTQLGRDPSGTGLLTSLTDGRGKTTVFGYDSAGNLTTITSPLNETTTIGYDSSGRATSVLDARGNTTAYGYDAADHLLTRTDPLTHRTTLAYDAVGNVSSMTDAKNHRTTYGYDAGNELVSVTAPDQSVTGYAYDSVGNLTSRTDANSHETAYTFDAANRLTRVTLPDGHQRNYSYNANGDPTSLVAPNGTTSYGYDNLDRLTSIDYSDSTPSVSFGYDADGNRTSMTDGAGTASYDYDALDRLTSVTRGTNVFSYAHDPNGNVTQRTYPDSTVATYDYDDDGRLAGVTSAGETTSYGYDAAGNLLTTTLPSGNGYVETRSYDQAGRLTEIQNAAGSSVLSDFAYTLDPVGNPTTVVQSGTISGTSTYTYDALDRLTGACFQASCPGASDPFIRWTYDPVGNRLIEARPTGTTSYNYNAADQLIQAGPTAYSYDDNGNETAAGSQTFAYDLANRLVSRSDATATTTYGYDGDGTRLSINSDGETTNELWDVNYGLPQLALEEDALGGLLRRYRYGADALSMTTPDGSFYYHHDALGSITNVTSETGASEWSYSYEPFGAMRSEDQYDPAAPVNSLKFAGEHLDSETNFYHLRARQYDPSSGRFLSIDPLTADSSFPYISHSPSGARFFALHAAADASTISPYAYARDQPTVLIDPSGAFPGSGLLKTTWGTIHEVGPTLVAAYHHPVEFAASAASYSLATAAAVGGLYVGRACWTASKAFLGLLGEIDHPISCGSATLFVAGLGTPFWYTGYAESQALADSETRPMGQSSK